jgi:hypothetical protein
MHVNDIEIELIKQGCQSYEFSNKSLKKKKKKKLHANFIHLKKHLQN